MKIGFTGTQIGTTEPQRRTLWSLLKKLHPEQFHHGDCIGADHEAHRLARMLRLYVVLHPPEDPKKRAFCDYDECREPKPYLPRNHDIVEESDLLLACPRGFTEERRSGTWATIRHATSHQRPIRIIGPDGTIREK